MTQRTDIIPISSIDAEQAVLGSILKDPDALGVVIESLPTEHYFYAPKHRDIYAAMIELSRKGEPCDITVVANAMSDKLEAIGGRVYLVELCEHIASTHNVASHAGIVKEKYLRRTAQQIFIEAAHQCYVDDSTARDIISDTEKYLMELSHSYTTGDWKSVGSLMEGTWRNVEAYESGESQGLQTGFVGLDSIVGGLEPANVYVLAGRPSQGKTQLGLQICEHISVRSGIPTAIISLEMSEEALAMRLLCSNSYTEHQAVKQGRLLPHEKQDMLRAKARLTDAPLYIYDASFMNAIELREQMRRAKSQHGIELFCIDYVQLLSGSGKKNQTREREVAEISRTVKQISKELHRPILLLSQFSREGERGAGREPKLSDLRDSGALEQDADSVWFVHHDDEKNSWIIIGKYRDGARGRVEMSFAYGQWPDLSNATEPEGM